MTAPRQHWTDEEEERLGREWKNHTFETRNDLVALFPGRTFKALKNKAIELGLTEEKSAVGESQAKVLETLRASTPLTKQGIMAATGLSYDATEQALRRLAERRKVKIVGRAPPTTSMSRGANLWAVDTPSAEDTASMMDKLRANAGNPFAYLLP